MFTRTYLQKVLTFIHCSNIFQHKQSCRFIFYWPPFRNGQTESIRTQLNRNFVILAYIKLFSSFQPIHFERFVLIRKYFHLSLYFLFKALLTQNLSTLMKYYNQYPYYNISSSNIFLTTDLCFIFLYSFLLIHVLQINVIEYKYPRIVTGYNVETNNFQITSTMCL